MTAFPVERSELASVRRPIRVLYVLGHGGGGGIERHVFSLVSCLDRRRVSPSVCVLFESGEESEALRAGGVPVHVIGASSGHDWAAAVGFLRVVRTTRPDIVHFHELHLAPALALRLLRRPRVLCSEYCEIQGARAEARVLWRLARGGLDRVLAISVHTAQCLRELLGVPRAKVSVFHNAVDIAALGVGRSAEWSLLPEAWRSAAIVGGVGRLSQQKDWPLFLSVASVLLRRDSTVRFVIVGDGSLREELEGMARSLGIRHAVAFAGRADARKYFPLFNVFLLTSRHEQLPTVLLEAFALHTPVAGCIPSGGTREVLALAGCPAGVFLDSRDPDRLADAVLELLHNPDFAARCAEEGYRVVREHFDMKHSAAKMADLYAGLLQSR